MLLVHGHPAVDAQKRTTTCDIENQDGAMCVLQVRGYETAVSLLTGRVPELQLVDFVVVANVLVHEVDADGGLRKPMSTLPESSKRSLMNLSIMELLPTAWSPSSTTLYRILLPILLEY
jgi:hypothetical protein